MVQAITDHGGIPDKFIGDGLLAVWGIPLGEEDYSEEAVEAAIEMIERLRELNKRWSELDRPTLEIGIGIHSGKLIAGNIGSNKKMDYTVIGDTVNTCSRIEGKTKETNSVLMISQSVYGNLDDGHRSNFSITEDVSLRGKEEQLTLYSLNDSVEGIA
jgi:adenylate cyclase